VLSPRRDDVDAFFTDNQQQQRQSFQQKADEDEWDDTRRWVDDLHHVNSSFTPQHQQSRGVGPGDSLNGNLLQSSHNRRGQHMPASQIAGIGQPTGIELDLKAKVASITIQRWYRKIRMRRKMAEAALKRFRRK
jgi:hypothetical protein